MGDRKSKRRLRLRMEVVKLLEAKFNEYGIIPEPFRYTYRGIKIIIEYSKQADKEWLNRLKVLQVQLHRYFGISMTFDIPWNENKKGKKILRVAAAVRNPEISEPKFLVSDNPLLCPVNPNWRGLIPFDKIKLEHFLPAIREGIKSSKKVHETVASYPEEPNFYNTFGHRHDDLALTPDPNLHYVRSIFSIYESLCTSDEVFEISKKVDRALTLYRNSIMFDRRIHDRALAIDAERYNQPLKSDELRILEEAIQAGKNKGYDLSKEDKDRLKFAKGELSQLCLQYRKNVSGVTNAVFRTVENIPGLPERALENMKIIKDGKVIYNITLQAENFESILEYCTDRKLRKDVYLARVSRAYGGEFDNRELCIKIANTLLDISKILGKRTVASHTLSNGRMRKNPAEVLHFLGSIVEPVQKKAKQEMKELNAFIASKEGKNFKPQPWDYSYYTRLLSQEKFNVDPEEIRKYFSYQKILQGVFWLAKELYNLDYTEIQGAPVYEDGVTVYEIKRGNQYMGLLYIDPWMRSNKCGGAYCDNLEPQGILNVGPRMDVRPITLIMMNFDKSGKLSFDNVQTLLHEFGHSLQETLSEVEYAEQSGNNVYWDYVELASQFMENFVYEREFLERFATDDEGNSIPQEYIESIKAKSSFMIGLHYLRQLEFCYLDMAWFNRKDRIANDVNMVSGIEKEAVHDIRVEGGKIIKDLHIPGKIYSKDDHHSTAFSHIFAGGYTAGYYSYLNADVLAADAFKAFGPNPIHNKEMADRFRRYILSAGNTEDPSALYEKFRGSQPSISALLEHYGIV